MLIYPTLKQSPIQGLIGGGGGASGYLTSGSVIIDDSAYSEFFTSGASPINISNSSYDEYTESSAEVHDSLDFFIDHSQNKFFGAYSTACYYTWGNGGNNYSGSANFYSVSGAQTDLSGHTLSAMGSSGRGLTIGWLGNGTPVIIIAHTSDNKFYFFSYPDGNYLGKNSIPTGTANNPSTTNDMSGLAWDGTRLLMVNRNDSYVYGYNLPNSVSGLNDTSLGDASRRWTAPHACQYGMAWTGDGLILTNKDTASDATYFTLSGSGLTGTHSTIRTFSMGTSTNYSLGIDYRNRKLVIGGYSINKYRVWGE